MRFNVQLGTNQASFHLIQWISLQMKGIMRENLKPSNMIKGKLDLICEIMTEMDYIIFESFHTQSQQVKMDILEKYLDKQFGKRMKICLKLKFGDFSEQNHLEQLAKLVCYFGVHSSKKHQFLNRILMLSQKNQQILMKQMQQVQQQLENIVNIKQIIYQIELLQYQNEQLRNKLSEMTEANSELLAHLKQSNDENKNQRDEIEKYRKQKMQVFTALKINCISDYLQAYQKATLQIQRYQELLVSMEQKLYKSQMNVQQLNERLKSDCLVISTLNQEITNLKNNCNQMQVKCDKNEMNTKLKLSLVKSAISDKQNTTCSASFVRSSFDIPSEFSSHQNQESVGEKLVFRSHNQQLMAQLETMFEKYNRLNQETSLLRQKNAACSKSNKYLRKILKEVAEIQSQFEYKYNVSSAQTKQMFNFMLTSKECIN